MQGNVCTSPIAKYIFMQNGYYQQYIDVMNRSDCFILKQHFEVKFSLIFH